MHKEITTWCTQLTARSVPAMAAGPCKECCAHALLQDVLALAIAALPICAARKQPCSMHTRKNWSQAVTPQLESRAALEATQPSTNNGSDVSRRRGAGAGIRAAHGSHGGAHMLLARSWLQASTADPLIDMCICFTGVPERVSAAGGGHAEGAQSCVTPQGAPCKNDGAVLVSGALVAGVAIAGPVQLVSSTIRSQGSSGFYPMAVGDGSRCAR
jgi:hypothetical protein